MRALLLASRRSGIRVGVAATVAALSLMAVASPAFAHENFVTGTASCATVPGTGYQVTWTITNDWNLSEIADVTAATGGIATLSQPTLAIPASGNGLGGAGWMPYASVTIVQTLPPTVSGMIYLKVNSTFSDYFRTSNTGEVAAPTDCPVPTPTTVVTEAAAPAIAALVSPTTVPTTVPSSTAPSTAMSTTSPPSANKIANSTTAATRPTLLDNVLPPAKPHTPIIKAATFTG
ncbi:MAG TPA: hypothetical protein VIJ34_08740 [Acidimicrobiales bacterium]